MGRVGVCADGDRRPSDADVRYEPARSGSSLRSHLIFLARGLTQGVRLPPAFVERMSHTRYYARAGGDPTLIALVASELRGRWDPQGQFQAPDNEYSAESHALAILGMLATG